MSPGNGLYAVMVMILAVISMSYFIEDVEAGNDHDGDVIASIMCLGQNVTLTETFKKAMKDCLDEETASSTTVSPTGNDYADKHACFRACKYRKMGVLVSDSKPEFDLSKFKSGFVNEMPEAARAGLKADIKKCFDAETKPLTNDGNCKSHITYQLCIGKAYMTNCKVE